MMHIIILCGPDGSGKKTILKGVDKVLSDGRLGRTVCVKISGNPIHVVSNKDGVKIGVAKRISKSDIKSLTVNSHGIEVLICSAKEPESAWDYCDLIQQAYGMYTVFLKRKEPKEARTKKDQVLCRQIVACSCMFSDR